MLGQFVSIQPEASQEATSSPSNSISLVKIPKKQANLASALFENSESGSEEEKIESRTPETYSRKKQEEGIQFTG